MLQQQPQNILQIHGGNKQHFHCKRDQVVGARLSDESVCAFAADVILLPADLPPPPPAEKLRSSFYHHLFDLTYRLLNGRLACIPVKCKQRSLHEAGQHSGTLLPRCRL